MKWSSTVSTETRLEAAIAESVARVRAELNGARPDLAIVFVSAHHRAGFDAVSAALRDVLAPRHLIGCSAGGVIGGGHEVENHEGLSLTAALLPGVSIDPFALAHEASSTPRRDAADPNFLLLADPFTFDAEGLLSELDRDHPRSAKIGGLASGGGQPGENVLYLDDGVLHGGLVGLALSGNIAVETLVAQGCRPIGDPMFVTSCRANVLRALDERPPLEIVQEIYAHLAPADQNLLRHSLFLGIVMKESRETYRHGDFLIRNIVGMDADSGALAVGAPLHEGLVVQFHLRDAATSAQDLETLLAARVSTAASRLAGALLFSCLGRGSHLYGRPDHDTDLFRHHLGAVPLGGFFCNGEIGPVGGSTFLHGYTSSFGLFSPRE